MTKHQIASALIIAALAVAALESLWADWPLVAALLILALLIEFISETRWRE